MMAKATARNALVAALLWTGVQNVLAGLSATSGANITATDEVRIMVPVGTKVLTCAGGDSKTVKCHVTDGATQGAQVETKVSKYDVKYLSNVDMVGLGSSEAVLCYKAYPGDAACVVLEVSGNTVTLGTELPLYVKSQDASVGDTFAVRLSKVSTAQALVCVEAKYVMYCATLKVTGKVVAAGAFTQIGKSCSPGSLATVVLSSTSAFACYPGSYDPNPTWCRQLVCTPLTLDLATGDGKVMAGAEKLMRGDTVQVSGEGDGQSETTQAHEMSATRLSDTAAMLCYSFRVALPGKDSYYKTLCNHVTASNLEMGPSIEVHTDRTMMPHQFMLPGTSTAILCHRACDPTKQSSSCGMQVGQAHRCIDVQLTGRTCSIGASWTTTRLTYGESKNEAFATSPIGSASKILACSGQSGADTSVCDTVAIDSTRAACKVYCDAALGHDLQSSACEALPSDTNAGDKTAPSTAAPSSVSATVKGSFTLTIPGFDKTKLEAAVKAQLAVEFGVDESKVTVVATALARRLEGEEGGGAGANTPTATPAGTWNVQFTVEVLPSQVQEVKSKAAAIGSNPAAFAGKMKAQLVPASGFTAQQALPLSLSKAHQHLAGLAVPFSIAAAFVGSM